MRSQQALSEHPVGLQQEDEDKVPLVVTGQTSKMMLPGAPVGTSGTSAGTRRKTGSGRLSFREEFHQTSYSL